MELLHRLSKIKPDINFILLIDQDDREIVTEAFGAGAVGLFQRDQPYEQLVKCIHCVHNGQVWASSQQIRYALDAFAGSRAPGSHGRIAGGLLSKREEEIVAKVAQGLRNREIANLLFISENTIKNHLFRIFSRLGISSRAELILFAHGHRLLNDQVHSDESDLKIVRNL
jgi:DNA-binding NarL/FixJ family response regulator